MNNVWIKNRGNWKLIKCPDEQLEQYRGLDDVVINPPTEGLAGTPPHHWKKLGNRLVPMTIHERMVADRVVAEHAEKERIAMSHISADKKKLALASEESEASHHVERVKRAAKELLDTQVSEAHLSAKQLSEERLGQEKAMAEHMSAIRIAKEREAVETLIQSRIDEHQKIMDEILKERANLQRIVSERVAAEQALLANLSSEKAGLDSRVAAHNLELQKYSHKLAQDTANRVAEMSSTSTEHLKRMLEIKEVSEERLRWAEQSRRNADLTFRNRLIGVLVVAGLTLIIAFKLGWI